MNEQNSSNQNGKRSGKHTRAHAKWHGVASVLALSMAVVLPTLVAGCGVSPSTSPAATPSPTQPAVSLASPTATEATVPAYWPTNGWRTSTPEEQGVDSAQLLRALQHVEDANINVRSLTVIRNGYIVLEVFRQPFTPTQQYPVFSVTKSVIGSLVGIALRDGYVKSLNERVLDSFPGTTIANRDANKEAITLENMLTMQSGLDCADQDIGFAVEESRNWVQHILDMPTVAPPGGKFAYCTSGPHLISAMLAKTTGMKTTAYAQARLFGPLGIAPDNYTWESDPQGVSIGGYGINMQTRDMAKLGLLYLYDGTWDGEQVVPREWMAASTTVHSTEKPGKTYGYLTWVYPDDPTPYFAAEGLGSQVIQVVKSRNMVVVMTAAITDKQGQTLRALLQDYIAPSAVSEKPLPANPSAVVALNAKVSYMANPVKPVPPLPETARRISGKTYVVEDNPTGLKEFTLAFVEGKPDVLVTGMATGGSRGELLIGLDNVYRLTPDDPTWRRARWDGKNTFVVRELSTLGIQESESRFTFTGDQVQAHAEETTLGRYTYDFKGGLK